MLNTIEDSCVPSSCYEHVRFASTSQIHCAKVLARDGVSVFSFRMSDGDRPSLLPRLEALGLTQRSAEETVRWSAVPSSPAEPEPPTPFALSISLPGNDLHPLGILGEGGMGVVLLAKQESLGREVALKLLKDPHLHAYADSLLHEARITGQLEHPGIIPVHAVGYTQEKDPVLVLKRVDGVSWYDLLKNPEHPHWNKLGTQSAHPEERLEQNLRILLAVCDTLQFAHSRGILHRDIKPRNIMLGSFGEVYLLDWGIACKRGARTAEDPARAACPTVGTPAYMPPEMFEDDYCAEETSDVFLLGGTLCFVLTGRPPNAGVNIVEVMRGLALSQRPNYPSNTPEELIAICDKAMAFESKERFPSVAAFRDAVREYLRHRGSRALTERAIASQRKLEALASAPTRDPIAFARVGSETRFAFAEALRTWNENTEAREGLARCLELLCRDHLARNDVDGARAILSEMAEPWGHLRAELAVIERRILQERAGAEAFATLKQELDLSGAELQRRIAAVSLLIVGLCVRWTVYGFRIPDPRGLLRMSIVGFIVSSLILALYRKHFLHNQANREFSALWMLGVTGMLAERSFAVQEGLSSQAIFHAEILLFAGLSGFGTYAVTPRLAPMAICCGCSLLLTTVIPSLAPPLHFLCLIVAAFAIALMRDNKESEARLFAK